MREIGVLAKKHPLTSLNHGQFRRAMDVCWENSESIENIDLYLEDPQNRN